VSELFVICIYFLRAHTLSEVEMHLEEPEVEELVGGRGGA
jgi:hypothetical protein